MNRRSFIRAALGSVLAVAVAPLVKAKSLILKPYGISPTSYANWRNYTFKYVEPEAAFTALARLRKEHGWSIEKCREVRKYGVNKYEFKMKMEKALANCEFRPLANNHIIRSY